MSATFFKPAKVRPAAVAGRFYPADAGELRAGICRMLAEVPSPAGPAPKAIIAPHAGYVFSGPIAASAYAQLASEAAVIRRVVLLGPSHFVPVESLAGSPAEAFATPLGTVPVDAGLIRTLAEDGHLALSAEAHAHEHSLEVQLPFLQTVLPAFKIVPVVVGEATADQVAGLLEECWGGPETRFVISSDLSHYLDWQAARQFDQATADAIETLQPELIGESQACGRIPICGLLQAARTHRLSCRRFDLRNSGDIAGGRDRVVGYGAFGLFTND